MSTDGKRTDLQTLLDQIGGSAGEGERVSLGSILDAVGRRSFGPLLMVAGLVTIIPVIGDIPGVPTLMGLLVLLTAAQLLLRREHIWFPPWLEARSVSRDRLCKALQWMRPVARVLDRLSRPRLARFTENAGLYAIAIACLAIAAVMPPMEFIPFSANGAGAALAAFGLALIAHDGLLALLAFAFTGASFGVVIYNLF